MESAIQSEKVRILTDDALRASFDEIDKLLTKNAELKKFRLCLEQNPIVLPELMNPDRLRQRLWVAYLIRHKDLFSQLLDAINAGKVKIASIMEKAKEERTKWTDVISIFNERFSVPFVVSIANQVDVILQSAAPTIVFDFLEDPNDKSSMASHVEEGALLQVLSNGEKRALYILNTIFEVEARKTTGHKTLFVVDDIADSFDYKNKYAIIEYLKEVSETASFHQIILSHNFDFYRTVSGRLGLCRQCRLVASKYSDRIRLDEELYQNVPFTHWRKHLAQKPMLIAAIPFLRNLAEFSGDTATFNKLTSLLHIKTDTSAIVIADLEALIKIILKDQVTLSLSGPQEKVVDVVHQVAVAIAAEASECCALEKKVAISIAIRLKAEEVMIRKINDAAFVGAITKNQTIALVKRFKADFPSCKEAIQVFEQVNLMTPENIHLNSFMYEPILDMSAHHLKKLYGKVCAIQ